MEAICYGFGLSLDVTCLPPSPSKSGSCSGEKLEIGTHFWHFSHFSKTRLKSEFWSYTVLYVRQQCHHHERRIQKGQSVRSHLIWTAFNCLVRRRINIPRGGPFFYFSLSPQSLAFNSVCIPYSGHSFGHKPAAAEALNVKHLLFMRSG